MPQPFVDRPDDDLRKDLMNAAIDGNLGLLKVVTKYLTKESGDPSAIFSFDIKGYSVLHTAACFGRLEICKYLVEELKGNVNAPGCGAGALGSTPFMLSASSGDVATVKYLLDCGGDLLQADDKGRTVLHHAVAAGCCEVTEFLLSKGVAVDIDNGRGTPAFVAAAHRKDNTLKILLDHKANPNIGVTHLGSPLFMALTQRSLKCMEILFKAGADVNCKGCGMSPLVYATTREDYTKFIRFLLEAGADPNITDDAGADPNITDDLGRLPVELAAVRGCKEEVQMLFPVTSPNPNVPNWSVEGVVSHAKAEDKKAMEPKDHLRRKEFLKSQADAAFKQKEYKIASQFYDMAICHQESATLYCNRSLCKLLMGDGKGALSDALRGRKLQPKCAKACSRVGAAHMLLQEYEQARNAYLEARNLDPGNSEIEGELRKAKELMKNPSGPVRLTRKMEGFGRDLQGLHPLQVKTSSNPPQSPCEEV